MRTDHPDDDSSGEIRGDQPPRSYGSIASTTSPALENDDHRSTLSFLQRFGFGLGHVYNDLCAGVWFSYTLLFMQSVLGLSAPKAGALVMLGQVSDAISTPIVGLLTDRYGTKRKWHIFGTCLVFVSFPMIFSMCPWCSIPWWEIVYFTVFIVAFQFGWPVVQVTHLAMISELSRTTRDRSDLTATRYSASICANLIVYITMWIVLQGRPPGNRDNNNIGPADAHRFRDISLILTLVGVSMSVIFHFSIAVSDYEVRRISGRDRTETDRLIPATESEPPAGRYLRFLKSPLLYQNALLYVFARLFMTTSLVYMPLWLDEQSRISAAPGVEHLATVPLVSFLASFVASVLLKHTNRWIGHQLSYLLGSLVSLIGCVWIAIDKTNTTLKLFAIAILFGSGSSVTMIGSLCITADMIGKNSYQSGFIYSAVTFADKLITGIVVVIIEALKCKNHNDCPEYYRSVLAYGCGVAAIMGIAILATIKCVKRR